jgi:hypothetical protein
MKRDMNGNYSPMRAGRRGKERLGERVTSVAALHSYIVREQEIVCESDCPLFTTINSDIILPLRE